jgi:CPA2 family monovalent cation:H+ antiporter-2
MTHSTLFYDVLTLLLAAVVAVPLARRFRVPPVIAYLAAGVMLGPYTPGPVILVEETHPLPEFGVVFLLFAIGLELPLSRLRSMRRYIVGLGVFQVVATAAAIGLVARLVLGGDAGSVLILGVTMAFSSTAAVLAMLVEKNETVTRFGRAAIAVLILQDLAVVPMLALLPLMADDSGNIAVALGLAGLKAAGAMTAIFLLGRFVVGPLYKFVVAAESPEVFTATNLLLILAVGWATAESGMSMALGAFLAGLLLSDSAYRHQVEADIAPFRGLLLGLFFMSVGMSINLPLVAEKVGAILGITAALIVGKAAILFGLARLFGLATAPALRVGLLLAQGGEFAFVLFASASELRVFETDTVQILQAVVALSMGMTPVLAWLGRILGERIEERWGRESFNLETNDLTRHVIVAGYGRVGRTVGRVLRAHDIPFVALETNAQRVLDARKDGLPVFYGNAGHAAVLRAAGLRRAQVMVVTLNHPRQAEAAVEVARREAPELSIVARAHDSGQRRILLEAGANSVIPETIEASLQIAGLVLEKSGVDPIEVDRVLDDFRRNYYSPPAS